MNTELKLTTDSVTLIENGKEVLTLKNGQRFRLKEWDEHCFDIGYNVECLLLIKDEAIFLCQNHNNGERIKKSHDYKYSFSYIKESSCMQNYEKFASLLPQIQIEVFPNIYVGDVVVSLTDTKFGRKHNDLLLVGVESVVGYLSYWDDRYGFYEQKECRKATPLETEAYHKGVRNINEMKGFEIWGKSEIKQFLKENPITKSENMKLTIEREHLIEMFKASTDDQKKWFTPEILLTGETTEEEMKKLHSIACETWKTKLEERYQFLKEEGWKPKVDEAYFIPNITDADKCDDVYWVNDKTDNIWFERGLAFKTKEEAILLTEKMLLMAEMEQEAKKLNKGWVADWKGGSGKYGIRIENGELEVGHQSCFNVFVFGISLSTKESAEKMLAKFKSRIEKFY